jgi:hypothetical protein
MKRGALLLCLLAALATALLLVPVGLADWWPEGGEPEQITIDGDWFYNWDFNSGDDCDPLNLETADMPVTMVFACEAEVDAVKRWLSDSHQVETCALPAGDMYVPLMSDSTEFCDADSGQCRCFEGDENLGWLTGDEDDGGYLRPRYFAPDPPDYFSGTQWDNYILTTTHFSLNHGFPHCGDGPHEHYGYSEEAAEQIVYMAFESGFIPLPGILMRNSGAWWKDQDHWITSDGLAYYICGDVEETGDPEDPLRAAPYPYDSDSDGDGVEFWGDNCPSVFNPSQEDTDGGPTHIAGDPIGDACDNDDDNDWLADVDDSQPLDRDRDGDTLLDGHDPNPDIFGDPDLSLCMGPWADYDQDGLNHCHEHQVLGSSDLNWDSDGDGCPDWFERLDCNGDYWIDIWDVVELVLGWNSQPGDDEYSVDIDINFDGVVDIIDVVAQGLGNRWNSTCLD